MTSTSNTETLAHPRPAQRRLAPALLLIVLAPLVAEVLSGSTRLSFIFVFIPEMMVWGCGALLIREVVRRCRGGGTSLVLLGLALAVAEEWVIQQTSLAPLPWVHIQYGRLWGVNWIWFLFFLVYECVWVVLVPIAITELVFPDRRDFAESRDFPNRSDSRWLGNISLLVSSIIFVVGSFIAWFLWTHIARPKTFHVAIYQPPAAQILLGLLMIAALAFAAYVFRGSPSLQARDRWTPPVWAAFLAALVLGVPWYGLMTLIFGGKRLGPFWLPMILGLAWAALAWTLLHRWITARSWTAMHRWALGFGATIVIMGCGFLGSGGWSRKDLVFKIVLNALAVAGFLWLAMQLRRNSTLAPAQD